MIVEYKNAMIIYTWQFFCLYDCLFCGDSTILYKFKNCYFYFKVVEKFLKPGLAVALATWYNGGVQVLVVECLRWLIFSRE